MLPESIPRGSARGSHPMDQIRAKLGEQEARDQASAGGMCCLICGEWALGPPHGWNTPCPLRVKESEAYVAMVDAQRMSYLRQGLGFNEMVQVLKRSIGEEDDDD